MLYWKCMALNVKKCFFFVRGFMHMFGVCVGMYFEMGVCGSKLHWNTREKERL